MEDADGREKSGVRSRGRRVAVVAVLGLILLPAVGGAPAIHSITVAAQLAQPAAGDAGSTPTATEATPDSTPTATPTTPPTPPTEPPAPARPPEPTPTSEPVATATADAIPAEAEASAPPPDPAAATLPTVEATTAAPTVTVTPTPTPDMPRPGDGVTGVAATPVNPVVALRIERAHAAFGEVMGTGEVDPGAVGVTSTADAHGASYVIESAIRLTVVSNAPWIGACFARKNVGTATGIRVEEGRLAWRLSGATEWTPFTVGPSAPGDTPCFPVSDIGTTAFTYDLRLRVERTDPPGTFASVVSFVVAPAPPA